MTLVDTLNARRRLRNPAIRLTEELDAAVAAIAVSFPGYEKSSMLTVEQMISALTKGVSDWEWTDVTVGQVTIVMRAWLSNQVVLSPPLENFLRAEISASTNVALLQSVCEAYLEEWNENHARTMWLLNVIKERLEHLPVNWQRTFNSLPELLDHSHGPDALAARLVVEEDPYKWLVANGVAYPHAGSFMRELHTSFLKAFSLVDTRDRIDVLFRWILPAGKPSMENGRAANAVDKLLEPWTRNQPDAALRAHLLDLLMDAYGDPRNHKPEFWSLVSPDSRKVVVRWLAGQSMDALLSIITRVTTKNHMWEPRHRFWKGLYDRGLIEEAWIALSREAISISDELLKNTQNPIYSMVSRQTARGERKDTCLLIMRIQRFIILEGSHDYRVHVFDQNDPHAPKFYEEAYDADAMRLPAHDPNTKIHDQFGAWRQWVESRIR
ncbi:EH signature domain-containing protein [Rhizobium sullae]|uniref:EH signature protein n=1 Tax=Rhizobium sullae TaxID=50338 RepID=A0A4R3Q734_RHISU|nr:EH signature domain-containing protein [Rhizobium sullae]TCU13746.1 EH signature protein [Rhizobium sullae]